jgi:hypothetical protein
MTLWEVIDGADKHRPYARPCQGPGPKGTVATVLVAETWANGDTARPLIPKRPAMLEHRAGPKREPVFWEEELVWGDWFRNPIGKTACFPARGQERNACLPRKVTTGNEGPFPMSIEEFKNGPAGGPSAVR